MFVVDTNVLVYAANRSAPEHVRCRDLIERWRGSPAPWYTTWKILYEFLRVVTHTRVMERPLEATAAFGFVRALLDTPSFKLLAETDRHAELAARIIAETAAVQGNLFHDLHTAVLMREHGLRRIYTRDTDFHRFRFLEVIDPLAT